MAEHSGDQLPPKHPLKHAMTVAELIAKLALQPQDEPVYLMVDGRGAYRAAIVEFDPTLGTFILPRLDAPADALLTSNIQPK
jgi:hypothetical protein